MSFYTSIFEKGTTISIIEKQSSWHKDDCYKIQVMRNDKKTGIVVQELNYVPKSQVDLAIHLKVTSCRLDKASIEYLEKIWEQSYNNGSTDESMSNAGADI
jgi:murein DD-endopeptidase MepM/ murein hydrolase activator NlpD